MFSTVTRQDFHNAFETRRGNFTHAGLNALFDYLEDYEESCGEKLKLDVIALCCEFTEYGKFSEIQDAYTKPYKDLDELREDTIVIEVPGESSLIIQNF